MISGKDIIIVGLQPWDIPIGSNCRNIAMELAKYNRVLYVNPPVDQHTLVKHGHEDYLLKRKKIWQTGENLVAIGENFWNLYPENIISSINWLPGNALFNLLNKRNNKKFAGDIRKAIQKLSFQNFILFNDSDMMRSYYLIELLQPAVSVYYSRDNLMAVKYWHRHGQVLEPKLMQKSTLVCANSIYLADMARKYNPHSFYVGQGCDISLFDPGKKLPVPDDIGHIAKPVIGYIGALISNRLDIPLLTELCSKNPQWSFVFVGKEDNDFKHSRLHECSNVHFLGLKAPHLLPAYLAQFDVAINPQVTNAMTIGNYPRKIDEYLAMGKPSVATETVTMEIFRDHVHLAQNAADYARLIHTALMEKDNETLKEKRIRFANTHTWENSVRSISDAIIQAAPGIQ